MGKMATMPCGGAERESRERRLINDATKAAGRYLKSTPNSQGLRLRRREEEIRKTEKSCEISSMEQSRGE